MSLRVHQKNKFRHNKKGTICPIENVTFEQREEGVSICVVQADGKKIEKPITN